MKRLSKIETKQKIVQMQQCQSQLFIKQANSREKPGPQAPDPIPCFLFPSLLRYQYGREASLPILDNNPNEIINKQVRCKMGAKPSVVVEGVERLKTCHPNMQDAVIIQQDGQRYIQNSQKMSKAEYDAWDATVGKAAGRSHSSFLYLPSQIGFVEKQKDKGHAVANYPNYPFVLSEVIKNRAKTNNSFKEKELYYILYAMASTKKDSSGFSEPLGDIRPQNIFLSQSQQVKIGSLYTFANQKSSFQKLVHKNSPDYHVYLAPEDLVAASQGRLENRDNQNSEVFAMGTTVMAAGLLQDMVSIYDYPSRQFNYNEHKVKINRWLELPQYSQLFKSIVLNMCHPQPDKRMSHEQLWQFLHQYEFNIVNKQQFLVTNPPNRLEEGVSTVRSTILHSRVKQ